MAVETKEPKFLSKGPGGFPVMNFGDGNGNYTMRIADNDNMDADGSFTLMIVFKRYDYNETADLGRFTTLIEKGILNRGDWSLIISIILISG
ncbi:MAG: hypothetical protein HC906_02335 [Bacteroidales bacterium]|nr:hypothetical protein [Bacteroidales bacterium]